MASLSDHWLSWYMWDFWRNILIAWLTNQFHCMVPFHWQIYSRFFFKCRYWCNSRFTYGRKRHNKPPGPRDEEGIQFNGVVILFIDQSTTLLCIATLLKSYILFGWIPFFGDLNLDNYNCRPKITSTQARYVFFFKFAVQQPEKVKLYFRTDIVNFAIVHQVINHSVRKHIPT